MSDLGEPLAEFQVRGLAYYLTLFGCVAAGLTGLTLLIVLLVGTPAGANQAQSLWVRILGAGLALLFVAVQLWFKARRMKGTLVRAFRHGLTRQVGEVIESLRWDEVNKLWRVVRSSAERVKGGQTLPGIELIL